MLRDLVLYAGSLVGAVGGGGVGFLVRLCVRAAMGSYSFVLSLSGIVMVLGMVLCTLGDGVYITGTLIVGGIYACVRGGCVDSAIDTLRDVCVFTCASN